MLKKRIFSFLLLYIDNSLTCFNPNDNCFLKNDGQNRLERYGNRYFTLKSGENIGFFRGRICGQKPVISGQNNSWRQDVCVFLWSDLWSGRADILLLVEVQAISQIMQFCEIFYVQYYAVICLFTAF